MSPQKLAQTRLKSTVMHGARPPAEGLRVGRYRKPFVTTLSLAASEHLSEVDWWRTVPIHFAEFRGLDQRRSQRLRCPRRYLLGGIAMELMQRSSLG